MTAAVMLATSCDFGADYLAYCAHTGNCRPSHVQGSCSPVNTAGGSPTVTVPDAGQDNLLLVTVMRHQVSASFTVSDSAGDVFQAAYPLQLGTVHALQTFYTVVRQPGPRVVTVNISGSPDLDVFVDEFQGAPDVPTVDDYQHTGGIGESAEVTVNAGSTDELVYIAAASDGMVTGFDGGPVLLDDCDHNQVGAFVSDAGAQALSVTFASAFGGSDAGEFDVAALSIH